MHQRQAGFELVAVAVGIVLIVGGLGLAVAGKPVLGVALVIGGAIRFMIRTAG
jgi:hypothetical protein